MTDQGGDKTMKGKSTISAAPRQKNWLLAKSRQWHMWGGLIAGVFILLAGASGIALNYKEPLFGFFGLERKEARGMGGKAETKSSSPLRITESAALPTMSVPLEQALLMARAEFGGAPLERIEIKDERGELIYKIKPKKGNELWINARTGARFEKAEREKLIKSGGGFARQTDWGKILIDLHTGKIGGEAGKAVMSLAALMLLFLTGSGVYLWAKPILIRRQNVRARVAASAPRPMAPAPGRAPEEELQRA